MRNWTCSSNEALKLSLVRAPEDCHDGESTATVFSPAFTYPIFGEDEKIYGYDGLIIDLRFASGSLAPYLSVRHSAVIPSSSTVDDVAGTLAGFLPASHHTNEVAWSTLMLADAESFKPVGDVIYAYTRSAKGKGKDVGTEGGEVQFEVYRATWDTPGFRELHRRMQLFILLYIEGGSYINEEEDQWEFVVLYEKRKRRDTDKTTYHFVGYSSLYRFYCFPERVRMRLSQFVILPPFQRQGHGSQLYTAIYRHVLASAAVAELTVEDPAEAFEDLRDVCDLRMLLADPGFMGEGFGDLGTGDDPMRTDADLANDVSHGGGKVTKQPTARTARAGKAQKSQGQSNGKGKLGPPVDKQWAEKWRVNLKIAGRQFQRLVEMIILLRLDPEDAKAGRAYRLQVKERLYRFNFEVLAQLDKEERLEKLQETFESVRDDYMRILALLI